MTDAAATPTRDRTVAARIVELLQAEGIDTIFDIPDPGFQKMFRVATERGMRVIAPHIVRYPSRRAFLELLSDPDYAPIAPYKFMALQVALVPVAAEALIPDLRLVAGALLLMAFLAVGWATAARG